MDFQGPLYDDNKTYTIYSRKEKIFSDNNSIISHCNTLFKKMLQHSMISYTH